MSGIILRIIIYIKYYNNIYKRYVNSFNSVAFVK